MKTQFLRVVSLFLGVYFLNLSVDVVAPSGGTLIKDAELNMQESILEIFLEKYLKLGDVIEETPDETNNEHRNSSLKKLEIFRYFNQIQLAAIVETVLVVLHPTKYSTKCHTGFGGVCNPPPEADLI